MEQVEKTLVIALQNAVLNHLYKIRGLVLYLQV